MSRVQLIAVEYETKDTTIWKAGVLAYSQQEAIDSIKARVTEYDRLISIGVVREVDIISKQVYDEMAKMFVNNKLQAVEQDYEVDENVISCPFCSKEYKTEKTLSNHIKKYH